MRDVVDAIVYKHRVDSQSVKTSEARREKAETG